MILKTLLVLEAAAKVALIVSGSLTERGSLLWLPGFNYNHVYHNFAVVVARATENYTLCKNVGSAPAFIYIADW